MAVHIYTSFTYAYLNRARVLAATLRRHHPDWVLWAVLTDKEPEGFRFDATAEGFDRVLTANDLFGDETDSWLFGHDVVEACTAVKGRALEHILDDPTADKVFYLDPDIAVFGSLDPLCDALDTHSILLTPHQLDPDNSTIAIIDNEIASLQYGSFNLGFLAVRDDAEARRFAAWWAERLHDWCHDRLDIGVFVDQKWCNLIPCFFDGVKIIRDPGYNVASWNLSQRQISIDADGAILVNDHPLRFFHFTKLGTVGDVMTRRYAQDNTEVYEIWWWYASQVEANTDPAIPEGWWHYGTYEDLTRIPKSARRRYREDESLRQAFPDPRRSGQDSFQNWYSTQSAG